MKTLVKLFLRGLAAILPLALTGYLVWAAVDAGERLLSGVLTSVFPEMDYRPGMGIAVSVVLVMAVGLLMYSIVVRTVYGWITRVLTRIPVIKSVYGMIVDVVRLFGQQDERPFRQVVALRLEEGGAELVGFVTRDDFGDDASFSGGHVAVYLPMSYQLGGFTVVVPRARTRELAMGVEEALRFCVTAGVSRKDD